MEKEFVLALLLILTVTLTLVIPSKNVGKVTLLNFSTDKRIYHSKEKMSIRVVLFSSDGMENVSLKVFGIKRGNSFKLNQEKIVDLVSGVNHSNLSFSQLC